MNPLFTIEDLCEFIELMGYTEIHHQGIFIRKFTHPGKRPIRVRVGDMAIAFSNGKRWWSIFHFLKANVGERKAEQLLERNLKRLPNNRFMSTQRFAYMIGELIDTVQKNIQRQNLVPDRVIKGKYKFSYRTVLNLQVQK